MTLKERKQEIRRLLLSSEDFDQARRSAECLYGMLPAARPSTTRATLQRALHTTIIVSYCRPFSGNKDNTRTKGNLDRSLLSGLTTAEAALHGRLLTLRNKVFAHSTDEIRDMRVHARNMARDVVVVPISHNPFVPFEKDELSAVVGLARKMLGMVSERIVLLQGGLPEGVSF